MTVPGSFGAGKRTPIKEAFPDKRGNGLAVARMLNI